MSTPLDNLDFETVRLLRKSLLITSVIGIAISYIIEYSRGEVKLTVDVKQQILEAFNSIWV